MSENPTGLGGFKEIIALMEGKGVFSVLKHESGVHRVQRVPVTEASGRISYLRRNRGRTPGGG